MGGPFLMNTREEMAEAYRDFNMTGFGGWPWATADPVHAHSTPRFARHPDGRTEYPEGRTEYPDVSEFPAEKSPQKAAVLIEAVGHHHGGVGGAHSMQAEGLRARGDRLVRLRKPRVCGQMRAPVSHRDIPSELPCLAHQRNRVVSRAKDVQPGAGFVKLDAHRRCLFRARVKPP